MKSRLSFAFGILVAVGCSAHGSGFDDGGSGDGASPDGFLPSGDGGFGDSSPPGDGGPPGVTTVYANTDTTLYTLNPQNNAVTMVGDFAGVGGSSSDTNVTDLAVNSAGDVYVNTESVVYKAAVPASPGKVQLTKIASIAVKSGQYFYALAFTPAGSLDPSEILIGGDGNGELFSIDTSSGATRDLGNFGADPSHSTYDFALSGDLVFYSDAQGNPTGLATVRPCKPKSSTCMTGNDYLVAVDMAALATAYKSSTPAASLLKGIYGGSASADGPGTGYGDLFGLGAWEGNVFAFARKTTANVTPLLLTISPTTGQATVVSSNFSFTDGWSGAGVTTSATITVPPPN
ncbi:MAG TPA: hypothetical protein VGH28_02725 [Polyangiaceae bacterium]|jgi:hypothetical protein